MSGLWKWYCSLPRSTRLAFGLSLGVGGLIGPYIMPYLDLSESAKRQPSTTHKVTWDELRTMKRNPHDITDSEASRAAYAAQEAKDSTLPPQQVRKA